VSFAASVVAYIIATPSTLVAPTGVSAQQTVCTRCQEEEAGDDARRGHPSVAALAIAPSFRSVVTHEGCPLLDTGSELD
jgi:predicted methyltransferase